MVEYYIVSYIFQNNIALPRINSEFQSSNNNLRDLMQQEGRNISFRGSHRRNYYLNGDEAFTEDNVLIYNLFAYKIPQKITNDELEGYFRCYGTISFFYVKVSQKDSSKRIAFVKYLEAKGAARVLKQGSHILNMKRFGVAACYSWQQPDVLVKSTNIPLSEVSMPSTSKQCKIQQEAAKEEPYANRQQDNLVGPIPELKILDLNDDVLSHICSLMRIKDQITFSRTCQRFQDVFVAYSKLKYKVFNMAKLWELTLWQSRDFFQLCGSFVTTLYGFIPINGRHRLVEFCSLHCVNVKILRIPPFNLKPLLLKKMIHKMNGLAEIYIVGNAIDDDLIYWLSHLEQLKVLRVTDNSRITGRYISMLSHIEELCLRYCRSLKASYMIEFLKEFKNLRVLDIQHYELCHESYRALIKYGENIEVLKFSAPRNISFGDVAMLPKLKHLDFVNNFATDSDIFVTLAEHKADQLEVLMYECNVLTAETFTQQTIQNIAKLRKLKMLSCCIRYTESPAFLNDLTKLKELTKLRLQSPFFALGGLLEIFKYCHKLNCVTMIRCLQLNGPFVMEALNILEDLYNRQIRSYPLRLLIFNSDVNTAETWKNIIKNKEYAFQMYLHLPMSKRDYFNQSANRIMNLLDDDFVSDEDLIGGNGLSGDEELSDDEYESDVDDLSNSDYFDSDENPFDESVLDIAQMANSDHCV